MSSNASRVMSWWRAFVAWDEANRCWTERVFRKIRGEEPDDPLLARLSPQERKILDLIADGLTNREIADEMFLAEKTVKNYVSNLLSKLEMTRRTEAAAYAARLAARKEQQYPPEQWGEPPA